MRDYKVELTKMNKKMVYNFDKIKSFNRLPGRDGRGYDVGVFAQPIIDLNDPDKRHFEILSRFETAKDDPRQQKKSLIN